MHVLMKNKRTEKGTRMTSVPTDQAAQNTARNCYNFSGYAQV